MSILALPFMKSLHLPAIRLPRWSFRGLGRKLCEATEECGRAKGVGYAIACGMAPHMLHPEERRPRELDY